MASTIKPPTKLVRSSVFAPSLFLGGTIDQGSSVDWQKTLEERLIDNEVVLYNPRRDSWDSTWAQDPTEGTPFYDQVKWEMEAQDTADFKLYHFVGGSASPITMLELGGWARSYDTVVSCEPSFYRYGNVKMFCEYRNIPCFDSLEEAVEELQRSYI